MRKEKCTVSLFKLLSSKSLFPWKNFFSSWEWGKLLYVNAIMTSVVVFGFFRIIRSCLVWETMLSWVYDTGKTNHDFNLLWAVSANRSDSSTDDQCLDSWKCCFHLGKWLKICFKDQWFYFFSPLLSIGKRFIEWKNERKPAEVRSVFFVLCPLSVKIKKKV